MRCETAVGAQMRCETAGAQMHCSTAVGTQMRCEMAVRGVSGPEGTWREMWDAGAARDAAAGPAAPCAGGRGDRRFSI